MTDIEQSLDAALREAYEKGFSDGREAAARVCDEERQHAALHFNAELTLAMERAAARIRALKSQE